MKTATSRLALLLREIYEMTVSVLSWAAVIFVGFAIWEAYNNDELWKDSWKCYSEGRIVAEGETRETPEWHGEGYSKLPGGRVIKGVCRW